MAYGDSHSSQNLWEAPTQSYGLFTPMAEKGKEHPDSPWKAAWYLGFLSGALVSSSLISCDFRPHPDAELE